MTPAPFLETPEGRDIIVRGRLWRKSNPNLTEDERTRLVSDLMTARRAVKEVAGDQRRLREARKAVDTAETFLGERGHACGWTARQITIGTCRNTPYSDWYRQQVTMQPR